MAAILPHLEVPDETTPIEQAFDDCHDELTAQTTGLSDDALAACPLPESLLADQQAGLVTLAFTREAVFQGLQGVEFAVHPGNKEGRDLRTVYMVLDQGIGSGPAWSPTTNPTVQQYKLLSWTSKMCAPSWSLPAGAPNIGGTCPGAIGGQSIVPVKDLVAARQLVNRALGRPTYNVKNSAQYRQAKAELMEELPQAICQRCYATGGQYSTGQVQYAQMLRFMWAEQAMATPVGNNSTAFIETMVYAIDHADFKLHGGIVEIEETVVDPETGVEKTVKQEIEAGVEPSGQRFFRLHDSGDFFNSEYLAQWKAITRRLPDITFWAPSRIWATKWGIEAVNDINHEPENLIIRPSAYDVNAHGTPALGPGWAATSTVIAAGQNRGMDPARMRHVAKIEGWTHEGNDPGDPRYTWNCMAYAAKKGPTCRGAIAPPGAGNVNGIGCRACWLFPDEIVNYTEH